MATVQCPTCQTETQALPPHRRITRCPKCGEPIMPDAADSAYDVDANENPVRDFVLRVYCRAMIILLIYVLSTGPMYWAIYEAFNVSGSTFLAKLYYPIALACEKNDVICSWFDWYVGLWVM